MDTDSDIICKLQVGPLLRWRQTRPIWRERSRQWKRRDVPLGGLQCRNPPRGQPAGVGCPGSQHRRATASRPRRRLGPPNVDRGGGGGGARAAPAPPPPPDPAARGAPRGGSPPAPPRGGGGGGGGVAGRSAQRRTAPEPLAPEHPALVCTWIHLTEIPAGPRRVSDGGGCSAVAVRRAPAGAGSNASPAGASRHAPTAGAGSLTHPPGVGGRRLAGLPAAWRQAAPAPPAFALASQALTPWRIARSLSTTRPRTASGPSSPRTPRLGGARGARAHTAAAGANLHAPKANTSAASVGADPAPTMGNNAAGAPAAPARCRSRSFLTRPGQHPTRRRQRSPTDRLRSAPAQVKHIGGGCRHGIGFAEVQ